MKKKIIIPVMLLVILGTSAAFYIFKWRIGEEIDSYKGVAVFYNGPQFAESYGQNYSSDGYYLGQKWQCVEFVKRFYYQAKEHRMPDVMGNAKNFFDPAVRQGHLNQARGLVQYRNGDKVKPAPDDLLIFTDTQYGHVAIVTKVGLKSIEVIQQNVFGHTRQEYPLTMSDDKYLIGSRRKPAGWLRKE